MGRLITHSTSLFHRRSWTVVLLWGANWELTKSSLIIRDYINWALGVYQYTFDLIIHDYCRDNNDAIIWMVDYRVMPLIEAHIVVTKLTSLDRYLLRMTRFTDSLFSLKSASTTPAMWIVWAWTGLIPILVISFSGLLVTPWVSWLWWTHLSNFLAHLPNSLARC